MKTCPKLERLIRQLAAKYGLDLTASYFHVKLVNPPYMPLIIEKAPGEHQLVVFHYYEQNGDLISDPEVCLFTGYEVPGADMPSWVPMWIQHPPPFGFMQYDWLAEDGATVERLKPKGQAGLAAFCDQWAANLRAQQFLERAQAEGLKHGDGPPEEMLPAPAEVLAPDSKPLVPPLDLLVATTGMAAGGSPLVYAQLTLF